MDKVDSLTAIANMIVRQGLCELSEVKSKTYYLSSKLTVVKSRGASTHLNAISESSWERNRRIIGKQFCQNLAAARANEDIVYRKVLIDFSRLLTMKRY